MIDKVFSKSVFELINGDEIVFVMKQLEPTKEIVNGYTFLIYKYRYYKVDTRYNGGSKYFYEYSNRKHFEDAIYRTSKKYGKPTKQTKDIYALGL